MNNTVFILLSFEGPDRYSHAGGLGSRIRELSDSLACRGTETHLFFVGDPSLPATETVRDGKLHLHRWCQWISAHHPGGVYDGEEGKERDWTASVVPWLESNLLNELIQAGKTVVVLAEEWQTVGSVIALREAVNRNGWDKQVRILWNLNNPFGTERINWPALRQSAVITTVSKYMKQFMWRFEVDARVLPNGISHEWFEPPAPKAVKTLKSLFRNRLALAKVARWDPDKRWNMTVDAVSLMKQEGLRPLLLARGGAEAEGQEVLTRVDHLGLSVARVSWEDTSPEALVSALQDAGEADVLLLQGYLDQYQLKVLYRAVDAVLANSGVEPFGLVGLEVMASGGLAFVGCTGEDYATPGYDCISVQTSSPMELAYYATYTKAFSSVSRVIRQAAQETAQRYGWPGVIARTLDPLVEELNRQSSTSHASETVVVSPPLPLTAEQLESVFEHELGMRVDDRKPSRGRASLIGQNAKRKATKLAAVPGMAAMAR